MSRIVWDDISSRTFQLGVSQGVLYLSDGSGVPWNGLTSVGESNSDYTVDSWYHDGVKYLDTRTLKDFTGTIKAFTYPDEFAEYDGSVLSDSGLIIHDQPVNKRFGLCYRTIRGNATSGYDFGYKLHILYNLIAKPDDIEFVTVSDSNSPIPFSWTITGVPVQVDGFRPSVHYALDTTQTDPALIQMVEDLLYGTEDNDPTLPDISTIVDLLGTTASIDIFFDGGSPSTIPDYTLDGGSS